MTQLETRRPLKPLTPRAGALLEGERAIGRAVRDEIDARLERLAREKQVHVVTSSDLARPEMPDPATEH